MSVQNHGSLLLIQLNDFVTNYSTSNINELTTLFKKTEEDVSELILKYHLVSDENLPKLLHNIELSSHKTLENYHEKVTSIFNKTIKTSPDLEKSKLHFHSLIKIIIQLNKHLVELNNSHNKINSAQRLILKEDFKVLQQHNPTFAKALISNHPNFKRQFSSVWKEAKHENELQIIRELKNFLRDVPENKQTPNSNNATEFIKKLKNILKSSKKNPDLELSNKFNEQIIKKLSTALETVKSSNLDVEQFENEVNQILSAYNDTLEEIKNLNKSVFVISPQSAYFDKKILEIQALLTKYKIASPNERKTLLNELDLLRQQIDVNDPSATKLESELGTLILAISTYTSLPKDINHLEDPPDFSTLTFLKAAKELIQHDSVFAYSWLRKLAKEENNLFLKALLNETKAVDFGNATLHADLLKQVASLHPGLQAINFKNISSSRLDLSLCSPKITLSILKKIPSHIQEVVLSPNFFKDSNYTTLLDTKFPSIRSLIISQSEKDTPVRFSPKELGLVLILFDNLDKIQLPPITLEDHLVDKSDQKFGDFLNMRKELLKPFKTSKSHIQDSIVRSLAKGTKKNGHQPITYLKKISFNRQLIIWLLNSPNSKEVLKDLEVNLPTHEGDYLNGESGRELCHLLLSIGKLNELTYLPNKYNREIDFSRNPLFNDEVFLDFIHAKNSSGNPNHNVIYQLNLSGNDSLSDKSIRELLIKGKDLQQLNLSFCSQITDHLFLNLPKDTLKNLRVLDIRNTFITPELVTLLKKDNPQIHILSNESAQTYELLKKDRKVRGDKTLINGEGVKEVVHKEIFHSINPINISERALEAFVNYKYSQSAKLFDFEVAVELLNYSKVADPALFESCLDWLKKTTTPLNASQRLSDSNLDPLENYHQFLVQYLEIISQSDIVLNTAEVIYKRTATSNESSIKPKIDPLDYQITIKSKNDVLEVPVNRFNVSSNSLTFYEFLKKEDLVLESKDPESLKLILNALSNHKKLNFENFKLNELLSLLKECDRFGVTHILVDQQDIVAWMSPKRSEIDFSDPNWNKLLTWSKKSNQTQIGLRFVMLANMILREDGKLKYQYKHDPFIKLGLETVITNPAFLHFEKLWDEHENTHFLKALFQSIDIQ